MLTAATKLGGAGNDAEQYVEPFARRQATHDSYQLAIPVKHYPYQYATRCIHCCFEFAGETQQAAVALLRWHGEILHRGHYCVASVRCLLIQVSHNRHPESLFAPA